VVIGVPKEIKEEEYRVSLVPAGAEMLTSSGHRVIVQASAGEGCGISDVEYRRAGAKILHSAMEVFQRADMIVKVKEPLPREFPFLKPGQILFTFLHLAPNPRLTRLLIKQKITAIAYETIQVADGSLPLLAPMSEVAGRMAIQAGAFYLHKDQGGRGILLGGISGVGHGRVIIIGGGTAGTCAAKVATGLGAEVTVLDVNINRLAYLEDIFMGKVETIMSNIHNIREAVLSADLLVGAVLIPGERAPRLVSEELVSKMKKGSVIVDVSVDQGGCVETIRPTTHRKPVYPLHGVIHYGVANMPGAVSRTSTFGLTNVTFPYTLALANRGVPGALKEDSALARGVNIFKGFVTHPGVAQAMGFPHEPLENLI